MSFHSVPTGHGAHVRPLSAHTTYSLHPLQEWYQPSGTPEQSETQDAAMIQHLEIMVAGKKSGSTVLWCYDEQHPKPVVTITQNIPCKPVWLDSTRIRLVRQHLRLGTILTQDPSPVATHKLHLKTSLHNLQHIPSLEPPILYTCQTTIPCMRVAFGNCFIRDPISLLKKKYFFAMEYPVYENISKAYKLDQNINWIKCKIISGI